MPAGGFTLPPKTLASIDVSEAAPSGMKRVVALEDNKVAVIDDQGVAHPAADLSSAVMKNKDGAIEALVSVRSVDRLSGEEPEDLNLAEGELVACYQGYRLINIYSCREEDAYGLVETLFRGVTVSQALLVGTQHDYVWRDFASTYSCSPSSSCVITGFSAAVAGKRFPGVFYILNNHASNTLTLKHQSTDSLSANRIRTPDGNDFLLGPSEIAIVMHAGTPGFIVRKL